MDDRLQGKYCKLTMLKGSGYDSITGQVIDESTLYYVVQADNTKYLVFKNNIKYISLEEE